MERVTSALSSVWSWRWCPTSPSDLESVEKRMLKPVQAKTKDQMIDIGDGETIRTLIVDNGDDNSADVPLVLVHGFGGGVGIWVKNLDALSRNRTVYAFDLLGFGRSSRPNFPPQDADAVEKRFVASIDAWRRELGIERFTLLGHSLGAYLATSYAIAHPSRVEHLILADPWGFPAQPSATDPVPARVRAFPWWIRGLVRVLDKFSPLAGLRAAGPWGPGLVGTFRPDFKKRFDSIFDDNTVSEYIYHCNAQAPSGEHAFKTMTKSFGWAKRPMIQRVNQLDHNIPITMVYGSRSWMDISMGEKMKELRPCSYVDIHIIDKAGHHVYSDQSTIFNNIVVQVCNRIEKDLHRE